MTTAPQYASSTTAGQTGHVSTNIAIDNLTQHISTETYQVQTVSSDNTMEEISTDVPESMSTAEVTDASDDMPTTQVTDAPEYIPTERVTETPEVMPAPVSNQGPIDEIPTNTSKCSIPP